MKVGINGFGRIGKCIYKILIKEGIEVPLINDPFIDIKYLEYLFKYDSVNGKEKCSVVDNELVYNGMKTKLSVFKDPTEIPWKENEINYVVECSGIFTEKLECQKHNVDRVILTAPSNNIPMYVYGVNHEEIKNDKVISAASCTTNCLAPLAKILNDSFGIEEGVMSTVHALTSTQKVTDSKSNKWRSGRSFQNIIPATTGAALAVSKVIPELKNRIDGMAFRVPVLNVSVVDFSVRLKNKTSIEKIVKKINECGMPNVIGVTSDEVVSSDMNGDSRSSILDINSSIELNNNFFKLVSWYDNEYGYSNRVVDLIKYIEKNK